MRRIKNAQSWLHILSDFLKCLKKTQKANKKGILLRTWELKILRSVVLMFVYEWVPLTLDHRGCINFCWDIGD